MRTQAHRDTEKYYEYVRQSLYTQLHYPIRFYIDYDRQVVSFDYYPPGRKNFRIKKFINLDISPVATAQNILSEIVDNL